MIRIIIETEDNMTSSINPGRIIRTFANGDVTVEQIYEAFAGMLISDGYQVRSIHDYIIKAAEEIKKDS